MMNIKMGVVRSHVLSAANAAALEAALNTFFSGASSERTLLDVLYDVDGGVFTALILYTE